VDEEWMKSDQRSTVQVSISALTLLAGGRTEHPAPLSPSSKKPKPPFSSASLLKRVGVEENQPTQILLKSGQSDSTQDSKPPHVD